MLKRFELRLGLTITCLVRIKLSILFVFVLEPCIEKLNGIGLQKSFSVKFLLAVANYDETILNFTSTLSQYNKHQ